MNIPALLHQAYRHLQGGELESATRLLEELLAVEPEHSDALQMLGLVNALGGNPRQAARLLKQASALDPRNAALHANLARAQWDAGMAQEAAGTYDAIIALGEANSDTYSDRGMVLSALGRHHDALASLDQAIALQADHADAWSNKGNVLHALGRLGDALACHDRALSLRPGSAPAWSNKAAALARMDRVDEALACYGTAIALEPANAPTRSNRGVAFRRSGRYGEALDDFNQALALDPRCVDAWINRGVLHHELMQHDKALRDYEQALLIAPGNADAISAEALSRLAIGDFETGWKRFEYRWKRQGAEAPRHTGTPLWLGQQPLRGKRILLWSEQGLGDTIQFCRYAPLVAAMDCEVIVEVPSSLTRLLTSLGNCTVAALGDKLPDCDFQTPLLSLPLALNTRAETIPSSIPYLHADPRKIRQWRDRIHHGGRALKIGIACSGNRGYGVDRQRSMALAEFAPLQKFADLILLQKGVRNEDEPFLRGNPAIRYPGDALADFDDTAAIVATLDLVISVDTALAHLAGALGKPVWILLPWTADWRWQAERNDSPWYPTARLFRQDKAGNWQGVASKILIALLDMHRSPA
jgi:tetratricopeptide (TPR) repeat protein